MGLSHVLNGVDKRWVTKQDLADYIAGRIDNMVYYFNREFCEDGGILINPLTIYKARLDKKTRERYTKLIAKR